MNSTCRTVTDFGAVQVNQKLWYPISNWDNSIFDTALILDLVTNKPDYRKALTSFLELYVKGDGSKGVGCAD
jgi:hypothetical protein